MAQSVDWSYGGDENGEDNWGMLSSDYKLCDSGTSQSPVQIGHTRLAKLPLLTTHYGTAPTNIRYDSHGMKAAFEGASSLQEGKNIYQLRYVSFHMPSEHMVGDSFYPLEMEWFHQNLKGEWLAVSVFVEKGLMNKAVDPLIAALPKNPGQDASLSWDISDMLPMKSGYYAYTGSLTSPPCTEGVEWRVLKTPLQFSPVQLEALARHIGRNARSTQPIYLRNIQESQ